ncbi:class III lanthionine synthetase LanKC [Actinomyces israelii]|uniref:class III lanthionine synthetase LanKC n=1 Tax=Actinomyces israelii TaxID=1659 RepID=UPI002354C078|nr:class III lanthionine synthetase LanKC [Actinomyces israelii]
MRPSELQFSRQGGFFYTSPDEVTAGTGDVEAPYRTGVDQADTWRIIDDGPWRHHMHSGAGPMADQGWKIHVSAVPTEAQSTLDTVTELFSGIGIPFKHLRDEGHLRASLAKYGDRVQCGKFVTAYPRDEREAVDLMEQLSRDLAASSGPVVLGDARWGRAPVFFRYGGYRLLLMDDPERGRVPALRSPDGTLVPDERSTSFSCPEWVDIPDAMAGHIAQRSAPNTTEQDWYPYEVESVMHFSNAGGVYLASCSDTRSRVVLKEARPYVGLDDSDLWAVDRLRHEAEVMRALSGVDAVVSFRELREIGGHTFLVEEYVDGPTLSSWVAGNYPFSVLDEPEDYIRRATSLSLSLKQAIEEVHASGYALVDLQPMNILIEGEERPRIIDLEAARPLADRSPITVGTPGFVGPDWLSPEENDWFAFNRVVAQLFFPLVPLNAISDDLIEVQVRQAHRLLSERIPFDEIMAAEPARRHNVVPVASADAPHGPAELRDRLVAGLAAVAHMDEGNLVIPGDVVSFSGAGRIDIESGLAGALFTRELADGFFSVDLTWGDLDGGSPPRGYLSGADGILLMRGESLTELVPVPDSDAPVDASLRSGLAGIALAQMASAKGEEKKLLSLGFDGLIAFLERLAMDPGSRIVSPMTSSSMAAGLIDGWSGVALALDRAACLLGDAGLRRAAASAFNKDLGLTRRARDGSLQVLDRQRLMPYFAEGSAGILLAILMASQEVRNRIDPDVLDRLARATAVRCTANGGLFMGRAGLLAARACAASAGVDCAPAGGEALVNELIPYCFVVPGQDGVLVGGQGGLRLSADYCSGNAGLVRVLDAVAGGPDAWALFPGLESLGRLDS